MLKKVSVNQLGDETTCIKAYDPSKQELIAVYNNYHQAANKLGTTPASIQHCCTRRGRTYSKTLNMEVAVRLATKKPGDEEMIEICKRKTTLYETTSKL
jgi:hypothetical protein